MNVPLAEHFHSLQGEGLYVGTPMHFVRLAGCSVGWSPARMAKEQPNSILPILKTGKQAWLCHAYDGTPFLCDTDFNKYENTTVEKMVSQTFEQHLCLSGGEPLIHQDVVREFFVACSAKKIQLHIETSGTILLDPLPFSYTPAWITVSPKQDFLEDMINMADELKILVGHVSDLEKMPNCFKTHHRVFIQPINNELTVDRESLQTAMQVLELNPQWRLSVQLHKFLNVR